MSAKRDIFRELQDGVSAMKGHRQGKLTLTTKGLPDREVAAGSVIDQAELDSSNLWEATGTADVASDLIVFRGRLLEYLRRDLRLTKR